MGKWAAGFHQADACCAGQQQWHPWHPLHQPLHLFSLNRGQEGICYSPLRLSWADMLLPVSLVDAVGNACLQACWAGG